VLVEFLVLFNRKNEDASSHHCDATPFAQRWLFTKKYKRKDGDEHQAQSIYGCNLRGIAELESAEVAHPRSATRQHPVLARSATSCWRSIPTGS